jgi:hypothetical protein
VLFALVAQRALESGSKLAGTNWAAHRVANRRVPRGSPRTYRGMDSLLGALGEIASEIFTSVATLLNLDLDLVFVDSTSTYWEVDVAEDLVDLAEPVVDDDGTSRAGRVAVADQSRQPFGSRRYACR